MKIAIIGSFNFHLECNGFILEHFKNDDVNIYIKKKSDKYQWLTYFKSLYNFNIIYNNFSKDIINKYDKIFKLTSNDYCLDNENIISILHLKGPSQLKCKSNNFISLTPYITGKNIHYIFPIFRPLINNLENNKIITMIGYYENKHFDKDTIKFININKDYKFNFIIYGSKNYSNLKNLKNVKIYSHLKTSKMMDIINRSKYILSKKYINYDRLSGQLALAMSFEKPLIINSKTKQSYNLPGITFNKEYCEIGNLENIDDDKYESLKNEVKVIKEKILYNNNLILHQF